MPSAGTAGADKESISSVGKKITGALEGIGGVWEGTSRNSLVPQIEKVPSTYGEITTQIDNYQKACTAYDNYQSQKENLAAANNLKDEDTMTYDGTKYSKTAAIELFTKLANQYKTEAQEAIESAKIKMDEATPLNADISVAGLTLQVTSSGATSLGGPTTDEQQSIVDTVYNTPSPGAGWCAAWVGDVFENAGIPAVRGDACDWYNRYCKSNDRNELKPGMVIAVPSHAGTEAGRIYGHVGIYMGDGLVADNVGRIRTDVPLDQWINDFGTTHEVRWGWPPDYLEA